MKELRPDRPRALPEDAGRLSATGYAWLQQWILAESGIVIEDAQQYMLVSRLVPVLASAAARASGAGTLEELSRVLQTRPPAELSKLVLEAITTNETFFFRDEPLFEALRTVLFPSMLQQVCGKRRLRVWSAAASTGQEAYSIAMLLREMETGPGEVDILGTDISAQVLDRAREGRYTFAEMHRGLPDALRHRYFAKSGNAWQIAEEIRSMVHFEPFDLRRRIQRLGMFDLILCRNVLIYFDTETKRKILGAMGPMLFPSGALALGCAETMINLNDDLRREQIGSATVYLPSTADVSAFRKPGKR